MSRWRRQVVFDDAWTPTRTGGRRLRAERGTLLWPHVAAGRWVVVKGRARVRDPWPPWTVGVAIGARRAHCVWFPAGRRGWWFYATAPGTGGAVRVALRAPRPGVLTVDRARIASVRWRRDRLVRLWRLAADLAVFVGRRRRAGAR